MIAMRTTLGVLWVLAALVITVLVMRDLQFGASHHTIPASDALELNLHAANVTDSSAIDALLASIALMKANESRLLNELNRYRALLNSSREESKSNDSDKSDIPVSDWRNVTGYFSLTTIPHRMARPEFYKTIDSLLRIHPTWPVYLSVPHVSKVAGNWTYVQWIQNYTERPDGRFHVIRTKEYGPATKLLGIVEYLKDELGPEDMIITVDDDRFYRDDTAKSLIENSFRFPDSIITHAGKVATYRSGRVATNLRYGIWKVPPFPIGKEYNTPGFVNRLLGCGAVLYRRKMIDSEWFKPEAHHQSCFNEDDTWFSMMAYFRKIPIFVTGCGGACANPHIGPTQGDGLSDPVSKTDARHKLPHVKVTECEEAVIQNRTMGFNKGIPIQNFTEMK